MSFSGKSAHWGTLLAATTVVGLLGLARVEAGGKREKIEFSNPETPVTASNLTEKMDPGLERLNPPPSSFKQVEDNLLRPFKNAIQPTDSMQGVLSMPPPGSQQQQQQRPLSKHAKELLDRRRNWAFTDLNDLYPDPTVEEALGVKEYGDDGKEAKPVSLMERYYNREGQKASQNGMVKLGEIDPTSRDSGGKFSPENTFIPDHEPYPELKQFGKGIFSTGNSSDSSKDAATTFKSQDVAGDNSEESLAAKKRQEEFLHLLDPNSSVSKTASPLGIPANGNNALYTLPSNAALLGLEHPQPSLTAAPAQPTVHHSTLNPLKGPVDPTFAVLHPDSLLDPTASALGQTPTPPTFTAPPPPPKTADTVRKMLDPFAAGLPKSKF